MVSASFLVFGDIEHPDCVEVVILIPGAEPDVAIFHFEAAGLEGLSGIAQP